MESRTIACYESYLVDKKILPFVLRWVLSPRRAKIH